MTHHSEDEQFERLVREALREAEAEAVHEGGPPSSAIVWWRSQMRARQEALRAAERPLAIVHAVSIACVAGLTLGFIGLAAAWLRSAGITISTPTASSVIASAWFLPVAVTGVTLLVASVAAIIAITHEERS